MKASELVAKLQEAIEKHGDLVVIDYELNEIEEVAWEDWQMNEMKGSIKVSP